MSLKRRFPGRLFGLGIIISLVVVLFTGCVRTNRLEFTTSDRANDIESETVAVSFLPVYTGSEPDLAIEVEQTGTVATAMVTDKYGRIYGGVNGYLFSYDPETRTRQVIRKPFSSARVITAMLTLSTGEIYGAASSENGKSGRLFRFSPTKMEITDLGVMVRNGGDILALAFANERIFGGTESGHLFSYDIKAEEVVNHGVLVKNQPVTSLVPAGDYLYCVPGFRYNLKTNSFKEIDEEAGISAPVYALCFDGEEKLYGATYFGGTIFSYDTITGKYELLGQVLDGNPRVLALAYGEDGFLYGLADSGEMSSMLVHIFAVDPGQSLETVSASVVYGTVGRGALTIGNDGLVYSMVGGKMVRGRLAERPVSEDDKPKEEAVREPEKAEQPTSNNEPTQDIDHPVMDVAEDGK